MINVVTLAKNDLQGLQVTYKSLEGFPLNFRWIVVTPLEDLEAQSYCQELIRSGIDMRVYLDSGLGIYVAMNLPIADLVDEDWVWYLNAGDLSRFDATNVKTIEKVIASDNGWAFGGHYLATLRNGILRYNPPPNEFRPSEQLFARKFVSHQATFMRGDLLKRLSGFNTDFKVAADWDLLVRASKISMPTIVEIPFATFYLGGFSSKNRNVGNLELLKLRTVHLSKSYLPKSYVWFAYRTFRNSLISLAETALPDLLDRFRKRNYGK